MNWLILGHVVFGLVAFLGSVLLVIGFAKSFRSLTFLQKASILLSVIGMFGTLVCIMIARGSGFAATVFAILGIVLVLVPLLYPDTHQSH